MPMDRTMTNTLLYSNPGMPCSNEKNKLNLHGIYSFNGYLLNTYYALPIVLAMGLQGSTRQIRSCLKKLHLSGWDSHKQTQKVISRSVIKARKKIKRSKVIEGWGRGGFRHCGQGRPLWGSDQNERDSGRTKTQWGRWLGRIDREEMQSAKQCIKEKRSLLAHTSTTTKLGKVLEGYMPNQWRQSSQRGRQRDNQH